MFKLGSLNKVQVNVLLASIMGDGELTKLYKGSRRKNSSYREHFGESQKEYREWKAQLMEGLFYITPKSNSLRSSSSPFFTNLFHKFYDKNGSKTVPISLLPYCNSPYFTAVLYMDDGSLSITYRINHKNKKIYLTPQIYLYLQNYTLEDLTILNNHFKNCFHINLHLAKRNDGHGYILRTTSVNETFEFLDLIKEISLGCPSMYYKTNWNFRIEIEKEKWRKKYPYYELIISSSDRWKNYSAKEIEQIILLKRSGESDKNIANKLGRSYWSIVYKIRELRKMDLL